MLSSPRVKEFVPLVLGYDLSLLHVRMNAFTHLESFYDCLVVATLWNLISTVFVANVSQLETHSYTI